MQPRHSGNIYVSVCLSLLLLLNLVATAVGITQLRPTPSETHRVVPSINSGAIGHTRDAVNGTIRKRFGLVRLNDGWLGHLQIFDIIMPLPIASSAFALFYEQIMTGAANEWLYNPQRSYLRIQMNELILELMSTAQMSIPWNVVYHFAMAMQEATLRGMTGRYVGYLSHPSLPINVGVHVSLGIVQVAAAA